MTYCDSPEQSLVVATGAGLLAGGAGLLGGLGLPETVALAGGLALGGELLGHALRGDVLGRTDTDDARDPDADTRAEADPSAD